MVRKHKRLVYIKTIMVGSPTPVYYCQECDEVVVAKEMPENVLSVDTHTSSKMKMY